MEDNQEPSILDTKTTSERKNSAIGNVKRKDPPPSEGPYNNTFAQSMDWFEEGEGVIGRRNVCRHMTRTQMSQILGWAINPHRQRILSIASTPLPVSSALSSISPLDPFMHQPTPPPKPSHLVLVTVSAQKKIQSILSDYRHSNKRPKMISKFKCKEWTLWSDDSTSSSSSQDGKSESDHDDDEDSTFKLFKNFYPTRHVQIHTPITADPGNQQRSKQIPQEREPVFNPNHLYHTMNESAVIALGMILQESLIAMVVPLARRHVSRCRMLEKRKQQQHGVFNTQLDPFHDPLVQWTVSPYEAIGNMTDLAMNRRKMDKTLPSSYLSSSLPPTRSMDDVPEHSNCSSTAIIQDPTLFYINQWCEKHNLDPLFVSKNMNLFHIFLKGIPTRRVKSPLTIPQYSHPIQSYLDHHDHTSTWVQKILYPPK